ncbi:segregation and condensation protein A [Methylomusa anaerophila]
MHLIEKDKIDIYNIPIAGITEQYLNFLHAMHAFDIEVASEFLVMAATLLHIKSCMLLPRPAISEPVEMKEEDPRQELVDRLLEYRKYKQAAALLEQLAQEREKFHTRLPQKLVKQLILPEGLTVDDLLQAFANVWESTLNNDTYAVVTREEISVKDKMQDIIALLRKSNGKMKFDKTIIRTGSRTEVIAAFLALLELLRLKRISVSQECEFASIYLVLKE